MESNSDDLDCFEEAVDKGILLGANRWITLAMTGENGPGDMFRRAFARDPSVV